MAFYDSHGGNKATEFVVEYLHDNILEMMVNCIGNASTGQVVKAGYYKSSSNKYIYNLTFPCTGT